MLIQDFWDLLKTCPPNQWSDAFARFSRLATYSAYRLRIQDFDIQERDGEVIVRGSVHAAYESTGHACQVALSGQARPWSYRPECPCEDKDCMHVYALIVEANEQLNGEAVSRELIAWSNYAQGPSGRASSVTDRDLFVGAVITKGDSNDPRRHAIIWPLLLEAPTADRRKPYAVSGKAPSTMERLAPGEFAKHTLFSITDYAGSQTITADDQEQAFDEVLRAGRVYLDRFVGKPLVRGDDVQPTAAWTEGKNGSMQLSILLPDQATVRNTLRLKNLWYLQSGFMGKLVGDPEEWVRLLQVPPVSRHQLREVEKWWARLPIAKHVPGPAAAAQISDLRVEPSARMTVRFISIPGASAGEPATVIPAASLSFRYGQWEIHVGQFGVEGSITRRSGAETVRVHQDASCESKWREIIDVSGLVPARDQPAKGTYYFVNCAFHAGLDDTLAFLRSIDYCEARGIEVIREVDLGASDLDTAAPYTTLSNSLTPGGEVSDSWFDLEMGVEIEGVKHNVGAVISAALADRRFSVTAQPGETPDARWPMRLDTGEIVRMKLADLRKLVAPVAEWMDGETRLAKGRVRLHKLQAAFAAEELGATAPRALADVRKGITTMREIAAAPLPRAPAGFKAKLRPYQREGLRWLNALSEADMGGTLADDMGLGKTLQLLAHILTLKNKGRLNHPALVVVPKSIVQNWVNEATRFAPGLGVMTIHGQDRQTKFAEVSGHDIIVTTYDILPRDIAKFEQIRFSLLVLDESKAVSNPRVLAFKAIRRLSYARAVTLSGTPLENRLLDVWSLFDITLPGLLGDQRDFTRRFATPIEKHGDNDKRGQLRRRIRPFLLRREKKDVLKDLPAKQEITISVELEGDQRALYESLRASHSAQVQQAIAERGIARCGIIILEALLALRLVCCHPHLVKLESARKVHGSAKLDVCLDKVREAVSEGRRILLFSAFTSMLDIIHDALFNEGIDHLMLTGKTDNRAALVEQFQTGTIPVFLLSLKAGGVGLNLTAADTIIHFDPWWNPAAENQATDRAHRIGQTKPITVYRLICAGTIEEKMEVLKKKKADLADSILQGEGGSVATMTEADIAELFAQ
ncbi:MAG: DEAD/DEAH box helicase [Rhodanobacter sp.]